MSGLPVLEGEDAGGADEDGEDDFDPADADTVCGLGNRKNDFFAAALAADGVQPYPGSVALLYAPRAVEVPAEGVPVSVAGLAARLVTLPVAVP